MTVVTMLELLLGRVTVPILSDIAYNVFDPMSTVKSPISGLGRGSCTACVASNTDPTPEGEAAKPIRPSSNQMRPFSVKRVWILQALVVSLRERQLLEWKGRFFGGES